MLKKVLDTVENAVVDVATRTGPILGPLPTAYLVGRATMEHLSWPWSVAVIAAIVVECLGVASTSTALTMWNFNQTRRKSDPVAPFTLAAVLVGLYFAVAIALTVALDVKPELATVSPAIFPVLSLTGTFLLAIRASHRRRLAVIDADKAERRARRKQRKSTGKAAAKQPVVQPSYVGTGNDTKERAAAILAERPGISGSELGRQLGRSERLGRKLKAELLPEIAGSFSGNGNQ